MTTICLCMVVRDEATILPATLATVAPLVDTWVVVDTGSVDGTPEVVTRFFADAGLPGELVHRPWVDFATNRTEAFELCRGRADYAWVHDADDRVVGTLDRDQLGADGHLLRLRFAGSHLETWRLQLLRTTVPWRYVGAVHEVPVCDQPVRVGRLLGDCHVEARSAGARSRDPERTERDRALLEAAVAANPDDPRARFYLAQACAEAGDRVAARRHYEHRAGQGGLADEVLHALLRRAQLLELEGRPWPEVQAGLLDTWERFPHRAEPLVELAHRLRLRGRPHQALVYARLAAALDVPADAVIVAPGDYGWRALDEVAVSAARLGRADEAVAALTEALADPTIPGEAAARLRANLAALVPPDLEVGGTTYGPPEPHLHAEVLTLARRPEALWAFLDAGAPRLEEAELARLRVRHGVAPEDLDLTGPLAGLVPPDARGDRAAVARACSHLAAWGDAFERDRPTLLLDDTARPAPDAAGELDWCLDEADEAVPGWDLLLLAPRPADGRADADALRRVEPVDAGAPTVTLDAYVVSPLGAARLVGLVAEAGLPVPLEALLERFGPELRIAAVRPALTAAPG